MWGAQSSRAPIMYTFLWGIITAINSSSITPYFSPTQNFKQIIVSLSLHAIREDSNLYREKFHVEPFLCIANDKARKKYVSIVCD
jgi:hypothetical protein